MRRKFIIAFILGFVAVTFFSLLNAGIDKKNKDELYRQVELFSNSLASIQSDYVD